MNRRELHAILRDSRLDGRCRVPGGATKAMAQVASEKLPVRAPAPLIAPAAGMIPVAFVLGKNAEVLDFAGPLEVFAGAVAKGWEATLRSLHGGCIEEPTYGWRRRKSCAGPRLQISTSAQAHCYSGDELSDKDTAMFAWIVPHPRPRTSPCPSAMERSFSLRPGCLMAGAYVPSWRLLWICSYIPKSSSQARRTIRRRRQSCICGAESLPASISHFGLLSATSAMILRWNLPTAWNTRARGGSIPTPTKRTQECQN